MSCLLCYLWYVVVPTTEHNDEDFVTYIADELTVDERRMVGSLPTTLQGRYCNIHRSLGMLQEDTLDARAMMRAPAQEHDASSGKERDDAAEKAARKAVLTEQLSYAHNVQNLMNTCIKFINEVLDSQHNVSAYEMRLTPIAGPVSKISHWDVMQPYRLMYGANVLEIRLEILRWGDGVGVSLRANGTDRHTVGEYEFTTSSSHCTVFKLPSIIHGSEQDSDMFLNKGWASVLMHTRVLLSCIIGRRFDILCIHEHTCRIMQNYKAGAAGRDQHDITFRFSLNFGAVAQKALFFVMSKLSNTKTNAQMYQLRMNDLADLFV